MRIGIVPGAMKPVHKGHWRLIEQASQECDEVKVFTSFKDRGTASNQLLVTGKAMQEVWETCLSSLLPSNVSYEFVTNPITNMFELIEGEHEYRIYTDPQDAKRFSLKGYSENAYFVLVEREGDSKISATEMRKMLLAGERQEFSKFLPSGADSTVIWDILTRGVNVWS